jgi:hypothetical protein
MQSVSHIDSQTQALSICPVILIVKQRQMQNE